MFLVARAENFARSNKLSLISLSPNASGTGVFTVASPSSNTDRTLTLPDESGTVITTAGVPTSAMPAGSVIQVVSVVSTATITTTSTVLSTILTASITPSKATNKILILAVVGEPDISSGYGKVWVYRDATKIFEVSTEMGRGIENTAETHYPSLTGNWLDSPATASSISYTVQIATVIAGTFRVGNNADHSLILMEIAA